MGKFSKKAQRHAKLSRKQTERMLGQAAHRSGPVTISYLPGFKPPPLSERLTRTKFPFTAIINDVPKEITQRKEQHARLPDPRL